MASQTGNFAVPFILESQASQEVTANEAFVRFDALIGLTLDSVRSPGNAPPGSAPANGTAYLVGSTPTGLWSSKAGKIAVYHDGGWYFATPKNGLVAISRDTGKRYVHNGTKFRILSGVTSKAYAATITPDADDDFDLVVAALTGNVTVANFTNTPDDGQTLCIRFLQDATGGRTVSFGTNYKFTTAVPQSLITTTASKYCLVLFKFVTGVGFVCTAVLPDIG
jgi:hypothetical protein